MSSIWYFARAILGGAAVVLTFTALKRFLEKETHTPHPTGNPLDTSELIKNAAWAKGDVIEFSDDIVPWINDNLETIRRQGAKKVFVAKGVALSDFVKQSQKNGVYDEISSDDKNAIQNSIILIAMNSKDDVVAAQMIRSQFGISNETDKKFNGESLINVELK